MNFDEANQVSHPVENQWHYSPMTKAGFTADTKEAIGFVRSYDYTHPSSHRIRITTGSLSDYWTDLASKKTGLHYTLEPYLKDLGL